MKKYSRMDCPNTQSPACSSTCVDEVSSQTSANGLTRSYKMLLLMGLITQSAAFVPGYCSSSSTSESRIIRHGPIGRSSSSRIFQAGISGSAEKDEITEQLERAKALIAKSKAKIEANGNGESSSDGGKERNVPFFASKDKINKKDRVIKYQDEDTGLFTTDGDKMAQLSEEEEWESRPLLEVFESEIEDNSSSSLNERDVAASIFGLRKTLQTEDYRRIFDKSNRFIGEDN